MFRSSLIIALMFSIANPADAGRKKNKDKDSSGSEESDSSAKVDVPDDANSKKFASRLLDTVIKDFQPSDGGGAQLVYSTFQFKGGNVWQADGYVEILDERMECTEKGGWTMEAATSAEQATVSWDVTETDCPGREAGQTTRAVLTISKSGSVDAAFR